ncbi:MAG: YbhB/YbcL family Raf kinase inhibitor-like protein [Candidatus Levybacteria bacterium]|nr:YbhB/YbcL family Raf kinase inhibitor-like protein [Candidatus Levybacteria bacterium]
MKITSTAFENNGNLPKKYTCEGEGSNPPLAFLDVPRGTKSLALIIEDPDAVSKKPWIHWVLFNISPNVRFIKEGSEPSNSQEGVNDSGENAYGPACPPVGSGVHHYEFRLFALDEKLEDMPDFTDKDMLVEAMHGHVLEQANLIGLYQNSKDQ